ncbi:hypothetical protein C0J52_18914 [Blattella germanica]|nr:hypothetical protein C0J52_18914 [Blattella germanica]
MGPKKHRSEEKSIEECVRRVVQESWRDPAMLVRLANAVKDSLVGELKAALDASTEAIRKLEAAFQERGRRIHDLESKLSEKHDDLEQYGRRMCLRVFGIPEERNEDTDMIAIDVAKRINVDLSIQDIDRSHRIGKINAGPVIIKFISYRKRSEVFRSKKLLKGSGITVREDLTKRRHSLLKMAITNFGLQNVWTVDGNIIVKDGDNKRRITRETDL